MFRVQATRQGERVGSTCLSFHAAELRASALRGDGYVVTITEVH